MEEKKGSIWVYLFIIVYLVFICANTMTLAIPSSKLFKNDEHGITIILFLFCSVVYSLNMIYVIRQKFGCENLEFLTDFSVVWIIPCFILIMLFFGEWVWLSMIWLLQPLWSVAVIIFVCAVIIFVFQLFNAVITIKKCRKEIKKLFVFLYILTVITILIGYGRLVRTMAELFTGAWWW